MWERRLSLKLLLAALNGKDSAVAMCRFCRLMGTTTVELLLNRSDPCMQDLRDKIFPFEEQNASVKLNIYRKKNFSQNIKIRGTIHPQMAGAKGSSCAILGCDSKVMSDERGVDILPCECDFKICRDCYINAVKIGGGICPGCKEPYKNTKLDEVAVDNGRPLPLPPPSGMSKMERRLSMMKSTKLALVRSQTGDFNHNRWLFETKGTYGYNNAIWPKEVWLWGMFVVCEIWFAFSWLLDQLPKLCPVNRSIDLNVLGDFNSIRSQDERTGSSQRSVGTYDSSGFNDWISDMEIQEIKSFEQVLHRDYSDHCPIILKTKLVDWGPKPFRNYLINRSKIGCISEIAIEGDKEKDLPLEVILPHNNNSNIKKKNRVNVPFGQYDLKVASEEVGQPISGPTHSTTKVYVRRNEVLRSNGKAQQFKEPAVDSNSVSKTDSMPSIQQDPIEMQCALLKEMGLTYGEDANKAAGGLLCMWNNSIFEVDRREKGRSFLLLEGRCISNNQRLMIVNVYAPCDLAGKRVLWDDLNQLKASNPNGLCQWISDMELQEIKCVGSSSTWIRPNGCVKSKLDRFLVSEQLLSLWPESCQHVLQRDFSDHCPTILQTNMVDWGPMPFRWSKVEGNINAKKIHSIQQKLNEVENLASHRILSKQEVKAKNSLQQKLWDASNAFESLLKQKSRAIAG
ncbi:Cellulose synthase-like protein D2 [Glycine soja]|uniref:Cellulose synthase-like protein D2 n=1 Tax=Glycine soja TaxID=3848 RepID=A0A445LA29_GLYSO|nr:Cellulose synthase-like protein D2 [Glycine soja]